MKTLKKLLTAGLMAFVLLMGSAMAQNKAQEAQGGTCADEPDGGKGCALSDANSGKAMASAFNFQSHQSCYVAHEGMGIFAVIDSIDCCVDVHMRNSDTSIFAFRYYTDSIGNRSKRTIFRGKGRHDLPFVLRPVSVQIVNNRLVVLASSKKDSSYLAVLSLCPGHIDTVINGVPLKTQTIARADFGFCAYGFEMMADQKELLVAGKNALGYDLITLALGDKNIDGICAGNAQTIHYHVPKQSDRIKEADPHGWGLALVAVLSVFTALCFIVILLKIVTALIAKFENKGKAESKVESNPDQEVYAAIAAAIHMYNEELHDEEPTVITIQKTERSWTPWNAKYLGMNKYFNNR